jgi:hypothetical protein
LHASLQLPASVQSGAVLGYIVSLTNPTSGQVALTPCPAYLQAASASVKDIETLNCTPSHGALGAHRMARFEMRLNVPADTPPGLLAVKWVLLGSGGLEAAAQGEVQVTT